MRRLMLVCVVVLGAAVTWSSAASAAPSSCAEVRAANPAAGDGSYTIAARGHTFDVWCADMGGEQAEYLALPAGPEQNFSTIVFPTSATNTPVRTTFTRVRFHPDTFTIDVTDHRFASSTGAVHYGASAVTAASYATAADCLDLWSLAGTASVDLRGTSFAVEDSFEVGGWMPNGTADLSEGDQVVRLAGGGYCGDIHPSGGSYLRLRWATPLVFPPKPPPGLVGLSLSRSGTVRTCTTSPCLVPSLELDTQCAIGVPASSVATGSAAFTVAGNAAGPYPGPFTARITVGSGDVYTVAFTIESPNGRVAGTIQGTRGTFSCQAGVLRLTGNTTADFVRLGTYAATITAPDGTVALDSGFLASSVSLASVPGSGRWSFSAGSFANWDPRPVLDLPSAVVREADAAAVGWSALAHVPYEDRSAIPFEWRVSPSCSPGSGASFPVGTTTVTCTAQSSSFRSTGSFTVTVLPAAPKLRVPADPIVVEATSHAGASVTYETVSEAPATCDRPSGSTFPVGSTVVTCTVSGEGATRTRQFVVRVTDTTPPVLDVADVVAEATGPAGAGVGYTATATDIADPAPLVVCAPISGATFPLGSTTVGCTATDASGNRASATFAVEVRDTTKPTVAAALRGVVRGRSESEGDGPAFTVRWTCTDAVGVVTQAATLNGITVTKGQTVVLIEQRRGPTRSRLVRGVLIVMAPSFKLSVTCTDAAGNARTATAVPPEEDRRRGR
jgi:hypothetical protein